MGEKKKQDLSCLRLFLLKVEAKQEVEKTIALRTESFAIFINDGSFCYNLYKFNLREVMEVCWIIVRLNNLLLSLLFKLVREVIGHLLVCMCHGVVQNKNKIFLS